MRTWLTLGYDPTADPPEVIERWQEAMPRMMAALAEVGHPSEDEGDREDTYKGVVRFLPPWPTDAVLMKAGQVCGIPDMVADLLGNGCRCALCRMFGECAP